MKGIIFVLTVVAITGTVSSTSHSYNFSAIINGPDCGGSIKSLKFRYGILKSQVIEKDAMDQTSVCPFRWLGQCLIEGQVTLNKPFEDVSSV